MSPHQCRSRSERLLLILAALCLLAGCVRSRPLQYYQLSAGQDKGGKAEFAVPGGAVIGLGPVRLPEYLDRPQIVSRTSANRLTLADGERWAEPLADSVPRALSEDLALLLGTDRIQLYPWPQTRAIDCQIAIEFLQFESGPDGTVSLSARWTIMGRDGKGLLPTRRSTFRVTAGGRGQEAAVGALSRALADLAREIAPELPPLLSP